VVAEAEGAGPAAGQPHREVKRRGEDAERLLGIGAAGHNGDLLWKRTNTPQKKFEFLS